MGRSIDPGDASPRFFDDHPTGSNVPWTQIELPKSLKDAGRHESKVERCRAAPANRLRQSRERDEVVDVMLEDRRLEAGRHHCVTETLDRGDVHALSITRRTRPALRGEALADRGRFDRTADDPAVLLVPD